jgi:dsDNA-specific endonuclease/ATPase MutS2
MSKANLQKAISDVKSLCTKFKPLLELGEGLEQIGQVQSYCEQLENRKEEASKQFDSAVNLLEEKQKEIEAAEEQIKDLKLRADEYFQSAKGKRNSIIEEAKAEAAKLIREANNKKVEASGIVQEALNKKKDIEFELVEKQEKLDKLNQQYDGLRKKAAAFLDA